jgi:hypothetical protein
MRKMLSYKKLASLLMLATVALTGCFEESGLDIVYDGPVVVEWDRGDTGNDVTYLAGSGQVPTDEAVINLVGPPQNEAITVQWRINQEASTAIEGVHYNILSDQNLAIPAGANSASVEFEVITDNFTLEDNLTIVFEIVEAGVPVSTNYGTMVQTLSITCPSDIPLGTWRETTSEEEVELTSLGTGMYHFSNFNIDYYNPNNNPIAGQFEDVCNELTLYGDSRFGVEWRGEGFYEPETQTISFPEGVTDLTHGKGRVSRPYVFEFVGE